MKAVWKGMVIAESDNTVVVEGNHYFPPESVDRKLLVESTTVTFCAWKGTANYYHLDVAGDINRDAAWYYAQPKPAASQIKDHVAFWKGVSVIE